MNKIYINDYPYIDEMRERKADFMKESGVSLEAVFCKEEVFEKNLEVSLQTYDEFKDKIHDVESIRGHNS